MARVLAFDRLWTGEDWYEPGYLSCAADGRIVAVGERRPSRGLVEPVGGIAVPGLPNLHGHAFQRAFAGRAERRGCGRDDSFWSWREQMYRFVRVLDPDRFEAIAALAAVEMLEGGFTSLAEFHYLHHGPGGVRYTDPAELARRVLAVGDAVGLRTTLLPVLYLRGGVQAPLRPEQARFGCRDVEEYLDLVAALETAARGTPHRIGIAPHSLRAVDPHALEEVVTAWRAREGSGLVHLHIAEQEQEVTDCERQLGARPVRWLLDHAPVDDRWCLVHATHVDAAELRGIAAAGAVVGLCPTTEANLGDGIFPDVEFRELGGRIGVGTDSHVSIDAAEELRMLEYGQRLRDRKRARSAPPGGSVGADLYRRCLEGGAAAVGAAGWGLQVGAPADVVVLDPEHGRLAGHGAATLLDALVFSRAGAPPIDRVLVGGREVVRGGRHRDAVAVRERYRAAVDSLMVEADGGPR